MTQVVPVLILIVFLLMAALMYTRKVSALLALPAMALLIAVIGGIPGNEILQSIVGEGSMKLHNAYTTTMFGAVLAELMNRQGIANALVRWVAEFAGDNPYILGITLTLVTAVLFSTLGGLGAVIMVGTIVLPVMLSLGMSSITAGALYLFGISLGGMFNLANWALYMGVLQIEQTKIIAFVVPFSCLIVSIVLVFLAFEIRNLKNTVYCLAGCFISIAFGFYASRTFNPTKHSVHDIEAVKVSMMDSSFSVVVVITAMLAVYAFYRHKKYSSNLPGIAMLTPFVPLVLAIGFGWEIISAFVFAITYGVLTTWKKSSINDITRSIVDGIATVIPAVFLMIGIGMLINAVSNETISGVIKPLIIKNLPGDPLTYIVTFTLLTPLALYRGPLSLWGMGSGLVELIRNAGAMSSQAIMGMLMSVGQVQGVCDPTNTHNIWIATYLGTDTHSLLKKTIPFAWIASLGGLILACLMGYVQSG